MRICLVTPHYPPFLGGIEAHVQHIATGLARRGHEVHVLTQADGRHSLPVEFIEGVRVHRFGLAVPSRNYTISPGLYRRLHEVRAEYDILHAHAYHALPALAAALVGCAPLVVTPHYHGTSDSALRRLLHHPYRRAGAKIFERARAVICVSEPEAELVRRHFPSCQLKIVIIPNGVDAAAIASAEPIQMAGPVVLSAGRLERYKRVDLTLRALAATPGPIKLAITGDGPMRARLERLRDELQLNERVLFLGTIPTADVYRWMRAASVLVTMSTTEAMGIVIVEALVAGDRVVASDIPAHRALAARWPEAISLLPSGASVTELAALIVESAGRPRVAVSVSTWEDVIDRTLSVYRAVRSAGLAPV